MFKVITANLNGIRSAGRKGFFTWLATQQADVICLQETKAQRADLKDALYHPQDYFCYFHDAQKKGYSGVAIYCKKKPHRVITKLDWPIADNEGRYIQVDYQHLSIASVYLPSGSSAEHRQNIKYDFLKQYSAILKQQRQQRQWIIAGDFNIVHKAIDIKNWSSNQKNSGCLPEERAWLDHLFDELGFIDAFRQVNQHSGQYTWWSNRSRARENNVGWRIDYQIITPALKDKVREALIYKKQWFSDHAPLVISYQIEPHSV